MFILYVQMFQKLLQFTCHVCVFRLGLLESELVDKRGSPIETLSNYLSKRLAYGGFPNLSVEVIYIDLLAKCSISRTLNEIFISLSS